ATRPMLSGGKSVARTRAALTGPSSPNPSATERASSAALGALVGVNKDRRRGPQRPLVHLVRAGYSEHLSPSACRGLRRSSEDLVLPGASRRQIASLQHIVQQQAGLVPLGVAEQVAEVVQGEDDVRTRRADHPVELLVRPQTHCRPLPTGL